METKPDPAPGSAAGRSPAPAPAEISSHFPQLEILEILGQGGMGVVYKARQPRLDRLVALKLLPVQAAADPSFTERFNREARALARLSHPGIVAVFDFGQAGPYCYFLMEYVDGMNLRQLVQSRQLASQEALAIVPQICEALQYAHDEGIVHRDIKPANILIDKRGRVKIADFGLAKLLGQKSVDHTLTATAQILGTPHYMAPEQMTGASEVDHRADIFSLGVVFYEMLTGDLPVGRFELPSRKVTVDVRLDDVVLRALERAPERRYQQASQVKTAIESITSTASSAAPPAAPPAAAVAVGSGSSPLRLPAELLLLAAATALLVGGGIGGWLYGFGAGVEPATRRTLALMAVCLGVYGLGLGAAGLWIRRGTLRLPCLLLTALLGIVLPLAVALNVAMEFRRIPQWPAVIPLWLGLPAAAWALVALLRTPARDESAAAARAPGALSVLSRTWNDWWSERARWFAVAVQAVLVIVHLVCLFGFFGVSIRTQWQEENAGRQFTYTVGAIEPWFRFETHPTPTTIFRHGIDPLAGSMLFAIAGFAAYYVVWRIEKVRKPNPGFWSSPTSLGIIWGVWAVAAVGLGMFLGHRTLKENRVGGGPLAPQLLSALEIRGVSERDQALRAVALEAAGIMDLRTVRRAIGEIMDNTLHDQTAADSALKIAQLKSGASNATVVARLIRADGLRDRTLTRIAAPEPP